MNAAKGVKYKRFLQYWMERRVFYLPESRPFIACVSMDWAKCVAVVIITKQPTKKSNYRNRRYTFRWILTVVILRERHNHSHMCWGHVQRTSFFFLWWISCKWGQLFFVLNLWTSFRRTAFAIKNPFLRFFIFFHNLTKIKEMIFAGAQMKKKISNSKIISLFLSRTSRKSQVCNIPRFVLVQRRQGTRQIARSETNLSYVIVKYM